MGQRILLEYHLHVLLVLPACPRRLVREVGAGNPTHLYYYFSKDGIWSRVRNFPKGLLSVPNAIKLIWETANRQERCSVLSKHLDLCQLPALLWTTFAPHLQKNATSMLSFGYYPFCLLLSDNIQVFPFLPPEALYCLLSGENEFRWTEDKWLIFTIILSSYLFLFFLVWNNFAPTSVCHIFRLLWKDCCF